MTLLLFLYLSLLFMVVPRKRLLPFKLGLFLIFSLVLFKRVKFSLEIGGRGVNRVKKRNLI